MHRYPPSYPLRAALSFSYHVTVLALAATGAHEAALRPPPLPLTDCSLPHCEEMPGPGWCQVKREPVSDEEDTKTLLAYHFIDNQLPSIELRPVKIEHDILDENVAVSTQLLDLEHLQGSGLEELAPLAPSATPVCVKQEPVCSPPAFILETLESASRTTGSSSNDIHMTTLGSEVPDSTDFAPFTTVKDEPLSEGEQHHLSGDDTSDSCSTYAEFSIRSSPKSWTQKDMENALEALRNHDMSLTKASARFGIPSTTLWQRAHKLGIDTPKKEGGTKAWAEADLRAALHALRAGALSANKASKAYGIPSSTLYKIARREGIRLAAPFNAAPTAWRRADLQLALASIRQGACSVQRAASQYGIPTGTLYGRCKREGIELSRTTPTPWSEGAMEEALEAVRIGQMSINQAAIHYNLPYSSLYGRFKRCKYQAPVIPNQTEHQIDHQKQEVHNYPPQDISYLQVPEQFPREYPQHILPDIPQDYRTMYYSQCNSIATS